MQISEQQAQEIVEKFSKLAEDFVQAEGLQEDLSVAFAIAVRYTEGEESQGMTAIGHTWQGDKLSNYSRILMAETITPLAKRITMSGIMAQIENNKKWEDRPCKAEDAEVVTPKTDIFAARQENWQQEETD